MSRVLVSLSRQLPMSYVEAGPNLRGQVADPLLNSLLRWKGRPKRLRAIYILMKLSHFWDHGDASHKFLPPLAFIRHRHFKRAKLTAMGTERRGGEIVEVCPSWVSGKFECSFMSGSETGDCRINLAEERFKVGYHSSGRAKLACPSSPAALPPNSPEAEGLAVSAPKALVGALLHRIDLLVVAVGVVLEPPLHAHKAVCNGIRQG